MLYKIINRLCFYIGKCVNTVYNIHVRRRNKNNDFTILCSNCIGGIIYNRLGVEMLSPTINMWETQEDFIKFALNPKFYVKQQLRFVKSKYDFPVAQCGDILLYFNHAKSEKEAENDWNRRKYRINYDNIYIIMYYLDKYSIEQIKLIEKAQCEKMVVLTTKPLPLEYSVCLKETRGAVDSEYFLDLDRFGMRTFEKQWDYVSWLNKD